MKSKHKKLAMIILIVVAVLFVIVIIINQVISTRIRKEVDKLLTAEEFAKYSITIRKVSANILTQSIHLKDIRVTTDTINKNNYLDIQMKRLRVNEIHIRDFLKDGKLAVDKIIVDDPVLKIGKNFTPPKTEKSVKQERDITSISINKLKINDGVFSMHNNNLRNINLEDIYFNISSLYIPFDDPNEKMPEFESFIFIIEDGVITTDDQMYRLSFEDLHSNYQDSSLKMKNIKVVPQYKKYDFSKKLGYQTDRIDASLKEVTVDGLDFDQLIRENIVNAQKININGVVADVFRNKQIPRPPDLYPPLPQQTLRKLNFKLKTDTVNIKQASVKYSEHVPGAVEAGYVFFEDLNGLIVNLNNDPNYFSVRNQFSVYATGALMGKSLARVRMHIPVISKSDTFNFSGSLEPMSLTELNAMTENNQNVKIESGDMQSIRFEGQANNDYATGDMEFLYDNLSIKMLKVDQNQEQQEKKFFSFIINKVIRKQNPPKNSSPFIASMYFERDKHKGVINFLWKTLLSGVKVTITPGRKGLRRKE